MGAHGCSKLGQSADELVEVTPCVVVWPECLTVIRIIAAMETLLSAIVNNWNTLEKNDRKGLTPIIIVMNPLQLSITTLV